MKNLRDIARRLEELEPLKGKLTQANQWLRDAEMDTEKLRLQYEKEQRDVKAMERDTFTTYVLRLVGKHQNRLEKEQREEIEAKAKYDRAMENQFQALKARDSLEGRVQTLERLEKDYRIALEKRRQELLSEMSNPTAQKFRALENEQHALAAQQIEVQEAIAAALQVEDTARDTLAALDKADDWATYDIWFGNGLISHLAKYEKIDQAESNFGRLHAQLHMLKSELSDVGGVMAPSLDTISREQRAIDYFFDNIFTDLSVRDRIRSNRSEIEQLLSGVASIRRSLEQQMQDLEVRLSENRRQAEALLTL